MEIDRKIKIRKDNKHEKLWKIPASIMIAGSALFLDAHESYSESSEMNLKHSTILPGISYDGIMHPLSRQELPEIVIIPNIGRDGKNEEESAPVEAASVGGEYTPKGKVLAQEPYNVWTVLEDCESGDGDVGPPYYVHWDNDSYHDGAAQFLPSTWSTLEASEGYEFAWQAPPSVQRAAEMELQSKSGWDQWPNCTARMRSEGYIE